VTVLLVVLALAAGAGLAAYCTERQRRIAAERIAGTAWAGQTPTPAAPNAESLEARALRIEGQRTRVTVVDRLTAKPPAGVGLSKREAERLWAVANGEQAP